MIPLGLDDPMALRTGKQLPADAEALTIEQTARDGRNRPAVVQTAKD